MDPDFADTYHQLGVVDSRNGQLANAVQRYRKAMQLDPGNGRTMGDAATTFLALGDFRAVVDLRQDMDEHLGPGNQPSLQLDYFVFAAQSKWQDAIELLDALPPQTRALPIISLGYTDIYMYSGNFQKAHEYMLKYRSYTADRELWQQEFTDKERFACEHAGILIEAGDKDLGQDLLRLFIRNFEAPPSGQKPDIGRSRELLVCYLVDGSFDKALDILDRETAQGQLLDWWWYRGKMPWWKQLDDNPRYIALVNRIESLLDEQRALLSEMDESGAIPRENNP
jgi:tetratricopeptide (TPR) repeat protein